MTDIAHRTRQPKGSPTGGEFAAEAGVESATSLSAPGAQTGVQCPRCGGPWGCDETCPTCTDSDGQPREIKAAVSPGAMTCPGCGGPWGENRNCVDCTHTGGAPRRATTNRASSSEVPRFTVDIDCLQDGFLTQVQIVDFTDEVLAMPVARRTELMNATDGQVADLVAAARADGRLVWDGEVRAHVAEAITDTATSGGRYQMAGWDTSAAAVRDMSSYGGPGAALMRVAGFASAMTDDERRDLTKSYLNTDVAALHEARQAAAMAVLNCGGKEAFEDVVRIRLDAFNIGSRHGGSREFTADGEQAVSDAASAIVATKYMRDRFLATDARREYLDRTTVDFTLEHYDTLVGPMRDVFGSVTELDHSPRHRERHLYRPA